MLKPQADNSSDQYDPIAGIDYHNSKRGIILLRALTNKLNQRIIKCVCENKILHVGTLQAKLKISQPVASNQLRVLRLLKIVTTKREGKYIFYSLNYFRL